MSFLHAYDNMAEGDKADLQESQMEALERRLRSYEQQYYIQDTRTWVGNAMVWWAHNDQGYTPDLEKAKRFDWKEAEQICKNPNYRPWPCIYIDHNELAKQTVVDMQYVNGEVARRYSEYFNMEREAGRDPVDLSLWGQLDAMNNAKPEDF